jgi:NAD(P)-dependent dehydrogenase (short-subunit alcohol dehydrogenase family)
MSGRSVGGRVVVITASARGIGRAAAGSLAAEGATVHLADVDGEAAERAVAEIVDAGGGAHAHVCDVTSETDVARLFEDVGAQEGRVDCLVNNAGIYPRLAFRETTVADLDRVLGVNFRGSFLCTMAVLPWMESAGGSIVYMSSGAGTLASIQFPTARSLPLYGAAKAAVDRWALGVAHELRDLGIAANVLYPGAFVRTDGLAALELTEEERADTVSPDFVAPAISWLAAQTVEDGSGEILLAKDFGRSWGPSLGS